MYKPLIHLLSTFLLLLLLPAPARAEAVVYSTTGYQVNISVVPISLVIHTNPCTWGYNYDVQMAYSISFTGNNPPSQMYTLQGTVGCGPSSMFFDLPNGPSSGIVTSTGNAWRGVSDCATATLASLGCTAINVQIHGPGISSRVVAIPYSHLPITLLSLEAQSTTAGMRVAWSTASEQDNAYFTVERSADAVTFSPVLQYPGAGNSSQVRHYATIDPDPLPGLSYYQLRQTDINGTSVVSHMVVAQARHRAGSFAVYPNPGVEPILGLPLEAVGKGIEVHSLNGRLVYTGTMAEPSLHLPDLEPGTYLVTLVDPVGGALQQCRYVRL